jgi:cytochrome c-type biogenesis protein CcmH
MLARSYVTLQRHKEAVSAYAKATESIQNDAQMYADYADALAMSKGGLDKESEALIDKALTVDPLNPKALSLKATVAFNNKDYQAAIDLWQKMLTVPGLEKAWATSARSSIEEARGLLHPDRKN